MTDTHSTPDPIDVQVGLQFRTLRKAKGWSQEQLGRSINLTFQQIQKYERGTNRISASMMVKAAKALGVTPSALLPQDDAPAAGSPGVLLLLARTRHAEELVEAFAAIKSTRQRRAVLTLTRSLAELPEDVEEEP